MSELTPLQALAALNELRSNIVATQAVTWSNAIYPLVAILDAAGLKVSEQQTDEQLAQHFHCYGGAGGFPGHLKAEPSANAVFQARRVKR